MKTNRWRNRILWMAFLVCLVLIFCLTAFHRPILNGKESESSSDQKHKVVFIAKSTVSGFWKSVYAGASNAATACNLDLTFEGPKNEEDYETQNQMIAKAVEDGAEVIIFSAVDYEANADAINDAAGKGVKVVVIDSDVDSKGVSVRIGTDNIAAGRMSGEAALKTAQEKIVVGIVNAYAETQNCREREQGFREVLLGDSRVKGIYAVNVSTDALEARLAAEKLLREHPEINVLIGFNEPLAVGVAQAVDSLGLTGQVHAVSFDSNVNCIELLQTGAVAALVVQNSYAMGYLGVEKAWQVLQGEKFDSTALIDTATTIVTKENMFTMESQKAMFSFG